MPEPECRCRNEGRPHFHFYGCPHFAPPAADPQMQAENMDYLKLLALVMWKHGLTDVSVTDADIAGMPGDRAVVVGPNPDNCTIRLRLMGEADAARERGRRGR